eukprot:3642393-Karenia_brevis.AAC.1
MLFGRWPRSAQLTNLCCIALIHALPHCARHRDLDELQQVILDQHEHLPDLILHGIPPLLQLFPFDEFWTPLRLPASGDNATQFDFHSLPTAQALKFGCQ